MAYKNIKTDCKNVFKNNEKINVQEFNKKWIELINLLEKIKKKF